MFNFLKLVVSFLPLCIESVEWDGDFLNVSGEGWNFKTSSVWRVSKGKDVLFACWDDQENICMEELVGLLVENVSLINSDQPIDPSFTLSDGRRLDVFCSSVREPWVMNLPDNSVYVGGS